MPIVRVQDCPILFGFNDTSHQQQTLLSQSPNQPIASDSTCFVSLTNQSPYQDKPWKDNFQPLCGKNCFNFFFVYINYSSCILHDVCDFFSFKRAK